MTKTVACLAGDGVGPELMAAATPRPRPRSRACTTAPRRPPSAVRRRGLTRSGHPLPASTRDAYRDADAIFVASPHEPAFDGRARPTSTRLARARVQRGPTNDLVVVEPVGDGAEELAVARAFPRGVAPRPRSSVSAIARRGALDRDRAAGLGRPQRRARGARRRSFVSATSRSRSTSSSPRRISPTRSSTPQRHSPAACARWRGAGCPRTGPGVFAPGAPLRDEWPASASSTRWARCSPRR